MTRACLIAAIVAAIAIAVTTTANAVPPAPEHARLVAMCGTWDVEMTFWFRPGGAGVTTKGTSTIRPLFDGLFVEEKIEGMLNGAPFTTLAWTGFNTATHQYEATRIASTNTIRIAETGGYDEATRQFELKADYPLAGDTWHQRTVIQPTSADAMIATSYLELRHRAGMEGRGDQVHAQSALAGDFLFRDIHFGPVAAAGNLCHSPVVAERLFLIARGFGGAGGAVQRVEEVGRSGECLAIFGERLLRLVLLHQEIAELFGGRRKDPRGSVADRALLLSRAHQIERRGMVLAGLGRPCGHDQPGAIESLAVRFFPPGIAPLSQRLFSLLRSRQVASARRADADAQQHNDVIGRTRRCRVAIGHALRHGPIVRVQGVAGRHVVARIAILAGG